MIRGPMNDRPLTNVSILIVDDDADAREVLETYLAFVGATVRTASNATEGLELFKASPPAIVLADIVMPASDGFWLLREIRRLRSGGSVPVIAFTGRVMPDDRDRYRDAGFDAHLPKPADLDDVTKLILILTAPARRHPPQ